MIKSKKDYLAYLEADRINLRAKKRLRTYLFHEIWRYQRLLRKVEYYTNCKHDPLSKLYRIWLRYWLERRGVRLGIAVRPNTAGPGLMVQHEGNVRVHKNARLGANCKILEGVNIGATGGTRSAPQIGKNVFIGSGAKLMGDIRIADGIAVGANAVVVKSFDEPNITIGGVPAKKISDKGAKNVGWNPPNTYLGE